LFLPGSWAARLILLAFALLSIAGLPIPQLAAGIVALLGLIVLLAGAWLIAHLIQVPWGSGLYALQDAVIEDGGDDDAGGMWIILGLVVAGIVGAAALLTFLVGNGAVFGGRSRGIFIWAQDALLLITVWLVFGVPNQAHRIRVAKDGYAQRLLISVITAAACVLTGSYLFLLHFGGGQLRNLKLGQLVVAIVFTVVLVAPLYRSLARACWRRGLLGFLDPEAPLRAWRKTAKEVRAALDRPTRDKWTPCDEKTPEAEKQDQGIAVDAVIPTSPAAEETTAAPT
jgi:hypothetical protein